MCIFSCVWQVLFASSALASKIPSAFMIVPTRSNVATFVMLSASKGIFLSLTVLVRSPPSMDSTSRATLMSPAPLLSPFPSASPPSAIRTTPLEPRLSITALILAVTVGGGGRQRSPSPNLQGDGGRFGSQGEGIFRKERMVRSNTANADTESDEGRLCSAQSLDTLVIGPLDVSATAGFDSRVIGAEQHHLGPLAFDHN